MCAAKLAGQWPNAVPFTTRIDSAPLAALLRLTYAGGPPPPPGKPPLSQCCFSASSQHGLKCHFEPPRTLSQGLSPARELTRQKSTELNTNQNSRQKVIPRGTPGGGGNHTFSPLVAFLVLRRVSLLPQGVEMSPECLQVDPSDARFDPKCTQSGLQCSRNGSRRRPKRPSAP